MPPTAATIGIAAAFGSRSSPKTISRLISSDTRRKNSTISASLTSSWAVSSMTCTPPASRRTSASQKWW